MQLFTQRLLETPNYSIFQLSFIPHKALLNLSSARDATVYGWENSSASAHWLPGCSYYSLPHWLVLSGYNVCVFCVWAAVLWLAHALPCETALGDVSVLIPHLSCGCFLTGYTGSCLWVALYGIAVTESHWDLRKVSAKYVFKLVRLLVIQLLHCFLLFILDIWIPCIVLPLYVVLNFYLYAEDNSKLPENTQCIYCWETSVLNNFVSSCKRLSTVH